MGDTWYQSLDYVNLPTTMNDSQARLDPRNGVLRVVISHQDPGIQNWIALGGCPQGAVTYRWNNADSTPVPTLRLMATSEIGDHLHPDTPRLNADDRAAPERRAPPPRPAPLPAVAPSAFANCQSGDAIGPEER